MQESVASTWFYKVRNSGACQRAGLVDFHFHDPSAPYLCLVAGHGGSPPSDGEHALGTQIAVHDDALCPSPAQTHALGVRVLDGQKSRSLDNHLAVSGLEGRDKVEVPASVGT